MKCSEIALIVSGKMSGDGEIEISGISDLKSAGPSDLAFLDSGKNIEETAAGCLLVSAELEIDSDRPMIHVENPKLAFAIAAKKIVVRDWPNGWHASAIIGTGCDVRASYIGAAVSIGDETRIGEGSAIFDGARIGRSVVIGKCTVIHPNAVIYDNVTIGNDCIIHAGTVIGADGFGYVRGDDGYYQFPQVGSVEIEDNVEIGANTCVDRGALGVTRIGEGTKIDNLVQIAHNVEIGKRVVIAAQTGISGSTVIEDDCVIGGQVGMGDHARVMSGAIIGSQAGVLPGKIVRPGVWWGTPVQPLDEYKRQNAMIKGIGRIRDELKEISKLVRESIGR